MLALKIAPFSNLAGMLPAEMRTAEMRTAGTPPAGTPGPRSMLEEQLEQLCSQAASVCVAEYEEGDGAAAQALVERAQSLLRAALDALEAVGVLYGGGSGAPADPEPQDGDRLSDPPIDGEDLADTLLLARMGLAGRMRAVRALGAEATTLERLSTAGGALRTVQKALGAVLRALVGAERPPTSMGFYRRNVERSLAIRRRYLELHRLVAGATPPRGDELRGRLRLAGNAIAGLLGQEIAVHLRTEDRALLLVSHGRIREWLRAPDGDPQQHAAGTRLWQDLVNVTTMFLDVSKREELVEHDAGVVQDVLRELPGSPADWPDPARDGALARLRGLRGRSAALDAILQAPGGDDLLARLRAALEDLCRTLGAAAGAEESPPSGQRRAAQGWI